VEHCIKGALAGKTRFLVTHNLNVLPSCDLILILETDGTLKISGTYEQLIQSGIDLTQYLGRKEEDKDEKKAAVADPPATPAASASASASASAASATDDKAEASGKKALSDAKDKGNDKDTDTVKGQGKGKDKDKDGALTTVEERKEGAVSFDTFWCYAKGGGLVAFFFTIFCQLGSQVLGIEANFWLSDWGKETTIDNLFKRQEMTTDRNFFWFKGYAGMQMASIFCLFASRMALNYHRTSASRILHEICCRLCSSCPSRSSTSRPSDA
jgi:hypothetical protein